MELKTINDVENSGLFPDNRFNKIIKKTTMILDDHKSDFEFKKRNIDITDTPMSPMCLDDNYIPILLSGDVFEVYKKMVQTINNPQTALEYSFLLFGKTAELSGEKCYLIDKIVDCTSYDNDLNNRSTSIDNEKLNNSVREALNSGYDFISIGHTHPNIPQEERKISIANYLTESEKNDEYIRDVGLNLSLQDFIQYQSIYEVFKNNPNITTCQTIIMYNGEMVMLGRNDDKLSRFTSIIDLATYEDIYVSSKEEFKKSFVKK